MTTTTPPSRLQAPPRSLAAWVLRQAILGLVILTVVVGSGAWLLHASIDPAAEPPTDERAVR